MLPCCLGFSILCICQRPLERSHISDEVAHDLKLGKEPSVGRMLYGGNAADPLVKIVNRHAHLHRRPRMNRRQPAAPTDSTYCSPFRSPWQVLCMFSLHITALTHFLTHALRHTSLNLSICQLFCCCSSSGIRKLLLIAIQYHQCSGVVGSPCEQGLHLAMLCEGLQGLCPGLLLSRVQGLPLLCDLL